MNNKELGFIGLGRMGLNMVKRILSKKEIKVIVYNRSQSKVKEVEEFGAYGSEDIKGLISTLNPKRKVVWLMLPAGKITERAFIEVLDNLDAGDIIIEGANSQFRDTLRRYELAIEKGVYMLDVGVSGGIVAAKTGYPIMVGGSEEIYNYCLPIFKSVGIKNGFDLVGGPGSGHYVKMVHNAIEYGMMEAISEGFDLLRNGSYKSKNLDLKKIVKVFNQRTIVSSFLMEMVEKVLNNDLSVDHIKPFVSDSGEGRWSAIDAIENGVPFVANSYALNARYISQEENSFSFRLLSAIRNEFGGHEVKN